MTSSGVNRGLSIVIPSFNSANWLPSTLQSLRVALETVGISAEVIVVDDGSTDETQSVLQSIDLGERVAFVYLLQPNLGRYKARLRGLRLAKNDVVLFLDSRVLVDPTALQIVKTEYESIQSGSLALNADVRLPGDTPLIGRFWEVPTHIFWSEYLSNPRPIILTDSNFDRVPKGLGLFCGSRASLLAAFSSSHNGSDEKLVSDDTKVLRALAKNPIRIDPRFSGIYRPRVNFKKFMSHSLDRGTLFVDSYGGTSLVRDIVFFVLGALPLVLAFIIGMWAATVNYLALLTLLGVAVVSPLLVALLAFARKANWRSCLGFYLYFYPFVVVFWTGLIRGLWMHRQVFNRRRMSRIN